MTKTAEATAKKIPTHEVQKPLNRGGVMDIVGVKEFAEGRLKIFTVFKNDHLIYVELNEDGPDRISNFISGEKSPEAESVPLKSDDRSRISACLSTLAK